jgi:hypothetical protein
LGKWDDAIAACKKALEREPGHFTVLQVMTPVYGMSGAQEEGPAVVADVMKINPGYSVE